MSATLKEMENIFVVRMKEDELNEACVVTQMPWWRKSHCKCDGKLLKTKRKPFDLRWRLVMENNFRVKFECLVTYKIDLSFSIRVHCELLIYVINSWIFQPSKHFMASKMLKFQIFSFALEVLISIFTFPLRVMYFSTPATSKSFQIHTSMLNVNISRFFKYFHLEIKLEEAIEIP